ncbi:MAG: tetratricopeptide repeat protein [Candidatus Kapaibacteriales bacterium]
MDSDNSFESLIQADEAFNSGDLDKARNICLQLIERFPDLPAIYSLLIQINLKEHNVSEAEKILELAINKFPINRSFQLLKIKLKKQNDAIARKSDVAPKDVDSTSPPENPLFPYNKLAFTTYPFLGRSAKIPVSCNDFPFHTLKTAEFEPIRNLGLRTSLLRLLEGN